VKYLDITEVVQRFGIPASTLRFYEEKRLIASTGRRGLHRLFDPGVLDRLALIALGRAAGFSLDEIARMLGRRGGRGLTGNCSRPKRKS
jgi:DNA-binding transcriptional MerR regulator